MATEAKDVAALAAYVENHVATKASVDELRGKANDLDASFRRFAADTEQKLDRILLKLGG
jgi:hypothetical protein